MKKLSLLKNKLFFLRPSLYENILLDFVDYNMVKEVFKKYNIDNFNYNKIIEIGLVCYVNETVEEKFGELKHEKIVNKILRDFLVFIDLEKIIDLTYSKKRYCDFLGLMFTFYKFTGFGGFRLLRLRDQYNQLKKRRLQDVKLSRLYLTFCG